MSAAAARWLVVSLTAGTAGLVAITTLSPGVPAAAMSVNSSARPPPAGAVPAVTPDAAGLTLAAPDLDAEIERLGAQAPRYPDEWREAFEQSADLVPFLEAALAPAAAGDPAAQYYVYTVLEECREYLLRDAAAAWTAHEHVAGRADAWTTDEGLLAEREHRRCRGFSGLDLGPLVSAMGSDVPGAAVEYAAVWFERAVLGGYPPALANLALRPYGFTAEQRIALLEQAVAGGDPDALWRVFGQATALGMSLDPLGVAWLIAACRAGLDCRAEAPWFRAWTCSVDGFTPCPRLSAVAHYWYELVPEERRRAHGLAADIERILATGRVDALPWPALPAGRS